MKLHTQITLNAAETQFGYEDSVLLLGSCFAENIGEQLMYHKFQTTVNPFGILFHPLAIERVLQDAHTDKTYDESSVFEIDGIWKSFIAHSRLNALTQGATLDKLRSAQQVLKKSIQDASHIFITLGTAWVYQDIASGMPVANCHKVPQKAFVKGLMPVEQIAASLQRQRDIISQMNPKAQVIFTVSPVRHLKDGMIENSRSKAHLIAAVHSLVNGNDTLYFPAYELMIDELRDYRFYASDMLHPSEQAIQYIWQRFVEVFAFAKAQSTLKEIAVIQAGLSHRPFNGGSKEHQSFLQKLRASIEAVQKKYPHIQF
tara:strand:- start:170243 stop:171187 length:945 start_codon:yes stop_codon:yes gene_type:complete